MIIAVNHLHKPMLLMEKLRKVKLQSARDKMEAAELTSAIKKKKKSKEKLTH